MMAGFKECREMRKYPLGYRIELKRKTLSELLEVIRENMEYGFICVLDSPLQIDQESNVFKSIRKISDEKYNVAASHIVYYMVIKKVK